MNRNDLHFHVLPGVDDGPATLEQALELAVDAVADGTTVAVATPHIRSRYVTDVSELPDRVCELRAALRRENIPLDVRIGGEIGDEMVERLSDRELDLIAQGRWNRRWVLLEAPFRGFDEQFHAAALEVRERGFGVLIAHPERAAPSEDGIWREVAAGSALQVNVWSLAGRHGERALRLALELVTHGVATVVASDAHADWRRPLLSRAVLDLEHAGVDRLRIRELAGTAPRRLLEAGLRPRPAVLAV